MKLLSYSGGATRAVQLFANAEQLYLKGYKPDILAGVSAGAILALPIHLGLFETVKQETTSVDFKDMFKINPTTRKGSISFMGWLRMLTFRHSFGVQDTRKFLLDNITPDMYQAFKESNTELYIFVVNPTSKMWEYFKTSEMDYLTYIEAVEASSHIPVLTDAVKINSDHYVDGGNWAHNPDWLLLTENIIKSSEVVSIYSRDYKYHFNKDTKWKNNVLSNIANTQKISSCALSIAGSRVTEWYCKANNIPYTCMYSPQVFPLNVQYPEDDKQLLEAYYKTSSNAKKILKDKTWHT
jgi:predicted acylesterase/phospholipase RssA